MVYVAVLLDKVWKVIYYLSNKYFIVGWDINGKERKKNKQ